MEEFQKNTLMKDSDKEADKMAYYNTCPRCGAHLDPGESCDCEQKIEKERKKQQRLTKADRTGQLTFCFKEDHIDEQKAI